MTDKLQEELNTLTQVTNNLENQSDGPNAKAIALVAKRLKGIGDSIDGEYRLKAEFASVDSFTLLKEYMILLLLNIKELILPQGENTVEEAPNDRTSESEYDEVDGVVTVRLDVRPTIIINTIENIITILNSNISQVEIAGDNIDTSADQS